MSIPCFVYSQLWFAEVSHLLRADGTRARHLSEYSVGADYCRATWRSPYPLPLGVASRAPPGGPRRFRQGSATFLSLFQKNITPSIRNEFQIFPVKLFAAPLHFPLLMIHLCYLHDMELFRINLSLSVQH